MRRELCQMYIKKFKNFSKISSDLNYKFFENGNKIVVLPGKYRTHQRGEHAPLAEEVQCLPHWAGNSVPGVRSWEW